jgi:hypothetical protein
MKYLIIIFGYLFILCSSCNSKKVINKKYEFDFDLCHASYKGMPIPFDKPLSEWVVFFGKYDRCIDDFSYVWDSLGILLKKSNFSKKGKLNNKENPDELFICFTNLNSALGKAGKLEFGSKYNTIFGQIIRRNEKGEYQVYWENKPTEPVGDDSLKHKYPLKTYKDTVIVKGAIVANNMSLKEVNNYRTQVKGNETFGYWDRDGNWKNERGSTNVKTGQFIDFSIDGEKSPCGLAEKYYYQTTLRYTEGVLEYVKVERIAKGKSMYWRK